MIAFLLEYWIQVCFGIILAILTYFGKVIHRYILTLNHTVNSVKTLLRMKLLEEYDLYQTRGSMPVAAKERVNQLYLEYRNLKEDRFMKEIMEKFADLPIETKEMGED